MRNQHDDGSPRFEIYQRLAQCQLALVIEIRVRLVEHNEERIAVQRARQRHALLLPGR